MLLMFRPKRKVIYQTDFGNILTFKFKSKKTFRGYLRDIAKGKKAFKKCASCHSIEDGGKNKSGPNLYNILNRGIATNEKFKYSKKLVSFANENPQWTTELMGAWLENSQSYIPEGFLWQFGGRGTTMLKISFLGAPGAMA